MVGGEGGLHRQADRQPELHQDRRPAHELREHERWEERGQRRVGFGHDFGIFFSALPAAGDRLAIVEGDPYLPPPGVLANPGRVSDVLVFSGFLIASPPALAHGKTAAGVRGFWGHGTRDPSIPLAMVEKGRQRLLEAGADLETKNYEVGHWIAPEEIRDAMSFLER